MSPSQNNSSNIPLVSSSRTTIPLVSSNRTNTGRTTSSEIVIENNSMDQVRLFRTRSDIIEQQSTGSVPLLHAGRKASNKGQKKNMTPSTATIVYLNLALTTVGKRKPTHIELLIPNLGSFKQNIKTDLRDPRSKGVPITSKCNPEIMIV